jgi:hypothetical protein
MTILQKLRFKIQELAADKISGVQYPRMNLRSEPEASFNDKMLAVSTRLGVGILSIFLGIFALGMIAAGLFVLYVLFIA